MRQSTVPEWYRGEALLAVAGRVGTTRLIDNMPVLVGPGGGALEVFSDVPAVRPDGPSGPGWVDAGSVVPVASGSVGNGDGAS